MRLKKQTPYDSPFTSENKLELSAPQAKEIHTFFDWEEIRQWMQTQEMKTGQFENLVKRGQSRELLAFPSLRVRQFEIEAESKEGSSVEAADQQTETQAWAKKIHPLIENRELTELQKIQLLTQLVAQTVMHTLAITKLPSINYDGFRILCQTYLTLDFDMLTKNQFKKDFPAGLYEGFHRILKETLSLEDRLSYLARYLHTMIKSVTLFKACLSEGTLIVGNDGLAKNLINSFLAKEMDKLAEGSQKRILLILRTSAGEPTKLSATFLAISDVFPYKQRDKDPFKRSRFDIQPSIEETFKIMKKTVIQIFLNPTLFKLST
ncbi:hypothetical protein [Coxiella burnetii]|uniref:hypothetical protein n=1 Tax=Coxiella burnetii TaxID=777 RepID=UPI002232C496|nr:hypothetical protein [Coxiella burnetii]